MDTLSPIQSTMSSTIQNWHRSLQTLYETINIQRACIICMTPHDAKQLYDVLETHDFPVQLCTDTNVPPQCWDYSKRLYIVSLSTPIPWIFLNDEVNIIVTCVQEHDVEKNYALLGNLYTYSQQCCTRPVFFISV